MKTATEAMRHFDSRPVGWAEKYKTWPRVAFIAHGLLPGYISTALITERLRELGREWPPPGKDPKFVRWFSFPVVPKNNGFKPVWVDFYIIPVLAFSEHPDRVATFMAALKSGNAYKWTKHVAEVAISEAVAHGVPLTIGWGALTKLATGHGAVFQKDMWGHLPASVSTTHGDAGTAAIVIDTLQCSSLVDGARVAILGANGPIGDMVSRAVSLLQPSSIMLVGKGDEPGKTVKLDRLTELRERVVKTLPDGRRCEVVIHQDKSRACLEHRSDVVVVATTGMDLAPLEVPEKALVLDMTTPAACTPDPAWRGRLVLTAGCGQFDMDILPLGFGSIGGKRLDDVGAGGSRVIWGCTGETIVRASVGWTGHVVGDNIPEEELVWCATHFPKFGFSPQPPVSFGNPLSGWSSVRQFVCRSPATTCSFPQQISTNP